VSVQPVKQLYNGKTKELLQTLPNFHVMNKDVLLMHALAAIKELSQENVRLMKRIEVVESLMQ
jgi:thymidine kinase